MRFCWENVESPSWGLDRQYCNHSCLPAGISCPHNGLLHLDTNSLLAGRIFCRTAEPSTDSFCPRTGAALALAYAQFYWDDTVCVLSFIFYTATCSPKSYGSGLHRCPRGRQQ